MISSLKSFSIRLEYLYACYYFFSFILIDFLNFDNLEEIIYPNISHFFNSISLIREIFTIFL